MNKVTEIYRTSNLELRSENEAIFRDYVRKG